MLTIEALAHSLRGCVTMFFLFWCFKLYPFRRRSRMMELLFICTLYTAFCHLKDVIFLVDAWKNNEYLNHVVNVIDLVTMPLVCGFFIEAVRPGSVTQRRYLTAVLIQSIFIPLFLLTSHIYVIWAAFSMGYLMAALTIVSVIVSAIRYRRMLSANLSYTERIDVMWVVAACLVYFITLLAYIISFYETTWLSEALYDFFSIFMWTFLFVLSCRHRVKRMFLRTDEASSGETIDEVSLTDEVGASMNINEEVLAPRLNHCMNQGKMYLNPTLSLRDVAQAMGTNVTYLSLYLNRTLGVTFYDFVNHFRVEEACRIIESMAERGRINMTEVAEQSGFNSVSSFNRYFKKVMGITPKAYYLQSIR